MAGKTDILNLIKESAAKRMLFLPHAVRQMLKPDRMITTKDVRSVIANGEVIEDYPEDVRGHSCLILGITADRSIHVVCLAKEEYLTIITAYVPNEQEWEKNMKCMLCQGKMNKAVAPFHVDRKGYHLTLDLVPAWVCRQCGEVYFDEAEVDSIQDIIQTLEDRTEKFSAVA